MEYRFSVCVYPLDEKEARALRERLQDLLLREIEERGRGELFMGPVECEEVDDGPETIHS